ncbi:MAG: type II toxin-antitoxin system death-on-curing family toxin [Microcystaceae cyanobacterium]
MIEPIWLDIDDICVIHGEILAESGGTTGVLNKGSLESTLNKPKNLYYYADNVTLYQLAASYGYGLVKNHCFVDGNKRIALIAVYTFLAINGIEMIAAEEDTTNFFLDLAASFESQEKCMEQMTKWLQDNSEQQNL